MSEKRRGGAWSEAARNDEGAAISAAPERIEGL
jgi:hypothetical protein